MPQRHIKAQEYMLLTASQASARLNISVRTLDRYQANGLVAPQHLPSGYRRFTIEQVDALMNLDPADVGKLKAVAE